MGLKVAAATRRRDGAVVYFAADGGWVERPDAGRRAATEVDAALLLAAAKRAADGAVVGPCLVELIEEGERPNPPGSRDPGRSDEETASAVCAAYWAY